MSLFQKSVINKYLKSLDEGIIVKARAQFDEFYGNKIRLHNIMQLKEENYQEGFLREIFVDVLGYTISPNQDYNLITEYKNFTGAKKADGAILKDSKATGVIELKSTKTTDLDAITDQAFNYKHNQPGCRYVITSNFHKLRFYIDDSSEKEEFDLFNMSERDFKIFWLILNKDSVLNDLPAKLKEETKFHEENISKQFYRDYQQFKYAVFNNLLKNNPDVEKLVLFKKSQKLLDRFLFVFFAEDTGLIPPNAISRIVEQWTQLKELEAYQSLNDRFKLFFSHLDKGHKYKDFELPPYNGGLFAPDDILDHFTIDDDVLKTGSLKMSAYDFNTDVDVNILGHIFEHSLNEMDEMTSEIEGNRTESKTSKRKKDGVFYTPKYITKYIVENTIGTLCKEKKEGLGLLDIVIDDTFRKADGKLTTKAKKLFETLESYRKWLLTIKVLDPACGSGAFLNQALNFFLEEHNWIADRQQEITGDAARLYVDTDKAVLENNIYGVDINEESVEIAKLSLWLRTAQKGRPLSDLSENIKCGNSLIDDPDVAGDKAFNWNLEFKDIMDKGGFDVVIGNPPYVQSHSISETEKEFIYKRYKTAEYQINTYGVFTEQFIKLLKPNSYYSLIIPNYWLSTKFDKFLRKTIFIDNHAIEVINTYEVFESATVDTLILTGQKTKITNPNTLFYSISKNYKTIEERLIAINQGIWEYSEHKQFVNGDEENSISFDTVFSLKGVYKLNDFLIFKKGMQPYEEGKGNPIQTREMMNEKVYHSNIKIDETYFPLLGARHIHRHYLVPFTEYIKYGENLAAPRSPDIFKGERILINRILSKNKIDGVLLSETYINNTDVFNLIPYKNNSISIKVLYAIVVSKLCATYFKKANVNLNRSAFPKINVNTLESFPVPEILPEFQKRIESLIDEIILKSNAFQESKAKFIGLVQDNFALSSISKKLDAFYESDFKSFISELKKLKINLSLADQSDWKDYFEKTKSKINLLQSEIVKTDNEIDRMVYELYELTEEEIEIVENSIN